MNRNKPISIKNKNEAELLNCPFYGFPKQECDTDKCMAWEITESDSGYCKLIERGE